ncbi:helix-turn-helix transcriptional regulator [Shewanella gaetbuli]
MSELMTIKDVSKLLNRSPSTIRRWLNEPNFPQPVKFKERILGWDKKALTHWLNSLNKNVH